jgi:hypothetical protein
MRLNSCASKGTGQIHVNLYAKATHFPAPAAELQVEVYSTFTPHLLDHSLTNWRVNVAYNTLQ